MDEVEVPQEKAHVESISIIRGDPMPGEIELTDTKLQIDVQTGIESNNETNMNSVSIDLEGMQPGNHQIFDKSKKPYFQLP